MSGAKNSKATDRSEVDCKSGQIEFDQVLSAYIARLPTLFLHFTISFILLLNEVGRVAQHFLYHITEYDVL